MAEKKTARVKKSETAAKTASKPAAKKAPAKKTGAAKTASKPAAKKAPAKKTSAAKTAPRKTAGVKKTSPARKKPAPKPQEETVLDGLAEGLLALGKEMVSGLVEDIRKKIN